MPPRPSHQRRRSSRRLWDSSSIPSSPPGPRPHSPGPDRDDDDIDGNGDETDNEGLSVLDPRRFTPTLHASLVSEILSLRREVEGRSKVIDSLEQGLHESQLENENLDENLALSTRELRSLRHQVHVLEGGSSSALVELTKERDQARDNISELRQSLALTQKKARTHEGDLKSTQAAWNHDKKSWQDERRSIERRVHIVEGRLKAVLDEVSAAREAGSLNVVPNGDDARDDEEKGDQEPSGHEQRRQSVASLSTDDEGNDHGGRSTSAMSMANEQENENSNLSLAQELELDDEEDFELMDDDSGIMSPGAIREERPVSVNSRLSSTKANIRKSSVSSEHLSDQQSKRAVPEKKSLEYRDAAVQFSPPVSPTLPANTVASRGEAVDHDVDRATPIFKDSSTMTDDVHVYAVSEDHTVKLADFPEPPRRRESLTASVLTRVPMVTTSTQTDNIELDKSISAVDLKNEGLPKLPLPVPAIAVHPPRSEPGSLRNSIEFLPQSKSVSCQANFEKETPESRSIGMQTEDDDNQRRPSLLPSAIPDLPLSGRGKGDTSTGRSVQTQTSKEKMRITGPSEEAYPGRSNDNGPLTRNAKRSGGLRRPLRSSSLFAGFEQLSDGEGSGAEDSDVFTDDDFFTRPFTRYRLQHGKMVPQHKAKDTLLELDEPMSDSEIGMRGGFSAAESSNNITRPPIPVPVRYSSRNKPRRPERAPSPTPRSMNRKGPPPTSFDSRKPSLVRRPAVRQARTSTTARRQSSRYQHGQQQQQQQGYGENARSTSSPIPSSRPPVDSPPYARPASKAVAERPNRSGHARNDSTAATVHPTRVVDAIAQTMVGEWMFKYVRRRRSFGVNESRDGWDGANGNDRVGKSGVRHKRWVWLAPYERSIMWSSKQPTSGPALLGKSGRKRKSKFISFIFVCFKYSSDSYIVIIKSVLDVKDDNPLPKGYNYQSNQFNRSILILTPQRALKFTAMSSERHFVWLTALSFLSDPSMGMNELVTLPPVPRDEIVPVKGNTAMTRKNPIRNSIKVSKGKNKSQHTRLWEKRSFTSLSSRRAARTLPPTPNIEEGYRDPSIAAGTLDDAASPPFVPRFSNHNRKRSRTLPRPPTLRSFSSQATMPSWGNNNNSNSPETTTTNPFDRVRSFNSGQSHSSFSFRRTENNSRCSTPPPVVGGGGPTSPPPPATATSSTTGGGNMFDAIGTVRMEAFIDRTDLIRCHAQTHSQAQAQAQANRQQQQQQQQQQRPMRELSSHNYNHNYIDYWGRDPGMNMNMSRNGNGNEDFYEPSPLEEGEKDIYYRSD